MAVEGGGGEGAPTDAPTPQGAVKENTTPQGAPTEAYPPLPCRPPNKARHEERCQLLQVIITAHWSNTH